jgi:YidC/Oxa1 family membrane protein insertase
VSGPRLRTVATRLLPLLGILLLGLLVAACATPTGSAAPAGSGQPVSAAPASLPPAAIPLEPAKFALDPISIVAWLFTPLYQTFFILLVLLDLVFGNIAIAIIVLTVGLRALMTPLYRRQIVSSRRMQLLSPELKEIQKRYKGDRVKIQQAQQQLYAERGISPLSGCLPILLVTLPLIPLYSVFSAGLSNFNPQAMLTVFGHTIVDLNCDAAPALDAAGHVLNPCLDPVAFGINWSLPLVTFSLGPFGLSLLGLLAGALMYLQSRMSLPSASLVDPSDPNQRIQRQMGAIFPLIYVFLGGTWPAGLLLYIVVSTTFSIVQQYLFTGWGGMFPIFGWQPAFAAAHTPRFPIVLPPPVDPRTRPATSPLGGATGRAAAIDKTIRHKERGRQGRRGRRR